MCSMYFETDQLSGGSMDGTVDSSCNSEPSQPRICSDMDCTFPFGEMCKACRLDREVRKEKLSKCQRKRQAKEWVEDTNVQISITKDIGQVFVALDKDAVPQQQELEKPLNTDEDEEYWVGSDEYDEYDNDRYYAPGGEVHPDLSGAVPNSFASDCDIHPDRSSVSQGTTTTTSSSSSSCIRSDLTVYLEPWMSDLFDRTLEGQMEDAIFVGGAEEDTKEVICPLCREPVGDPTYQHLLKCQFAHEEQERVEALWRR